MREFKLGVRASLIKPGLKIKSIFCIRFTLPDPVTSLHEVEEIIGSYRTEEGKTCFR